MSLVSTAAALGSAITRGARDRNTDARGSAYSAGTGDYDALEAYYDGSSYEALDSAVASYKRRYGLYRGIRAINNPTRRAVDWHASHVYPGAWTPDGLPTADGTPAAVPFAAATADPVRLAALQALAWGNWRSERYVYVRRGATLGDSFLEIVPDVVRRMVYPLTTHPRWIADIEWNRAGDITAYKLEIPQIDEHDRAYLWGKVVTKTQYQTLKDGEPFGYDGQTATIPNPFGFVPAAWVQHRNVGGQHGASAIDQVVTKIWELNGMASSSHDYIGKFAAQGVVFKTNSTLAGNITPLLDDFSEYSAENRSADRDRIRFLKGPADLTIDRLIQNLGLGDALGYVDRMIREIERDLPEIVMDEQLRQMSAVTGPGARQMMGDLAGKLSEAQENYDAGLVKAAQMCVSMGGFLARSGAWGTRSGLTEAQRRFLPFDLASYAKGELAMELLPRPLVPETPMERVAAAAARAGLEHPTSLREAGYSDEDIYGPLATGETAYPRVGILAERRDVDGRISDGVAAMFGSGGGIA